MDFKTIFDGWGTEIISTLIAVFLGVIGFNAIKYYKKNRINCTNKTVDDHSKKISAKKSEIDDHSNTVHNSGNITINYYNTNESNLNHKELFQNGNIQKHPISLKDYLQNKLNEKNSTASPIVDKSKDIEKEFDTILGNSFGEELNNTEKQILLLLYFNSNISVQEICCQLGFSRNAIVRRIKKLESLNIIKREGDLKNGEWIINKM